MGLMLKLGNWLSFAVGAPAGAEPQPAAGETKRRFVEAAGTTIDDEDEGWRRLSGDSRRELSPMTRERMQELAVYLWRTNPLANRLVELPVAYLLADGVTLTVPDEEAQKWIDAFWRDPINTMAIKLPKKVRELALYGEQCWPTFVNEVNGHVRLGYLDPGLIETVVTDPDNIEQPIGVVVRRNKKGQQRRYRVIINGPEDVFSARTRGIRDTFTDGEAFYFAVNDLSNTSRGNSDLLPEMDWLDAYDKAMFGELERWDFLRAFIYDVKLKGATPDEVAKRAKEIVPPKPGSVRVHNDSEEWDAVAPELGSYESGNNARLFRNHILGGLTVPEHWFGGGGDVNRATAGEMGEPTVKVFTMRQTFLGHVLQMLGAYQIRQRLRAIGRDIESLTDDDVYQVSANFPELTARDTTKFATALQQVVVAAAAAVDRHLLSEATAIALIALVAGQLGLEIDPAAELEAAGADAARRAEADTFPGLGDGGDETAAP
ncbi:phage portal protein [Shumkonia mesophila]|uniref:hypothetical protein n=1 Tax=Shumkonia mesophila TaxID=2838854 RepID=UPI002934B972|nr:hypothetical protein [Shumkonia mesophila]